MGKTGKITFLDLGEMEYAAAWQYQEERFNRLVEFKREQGNGSPPEQYLLFCEHPHVYTLERAVTKQTC